MKINFSWSTTPNNNPNLMTVGGNSTFYWGEGIGNFSLATAKNLIKNSPNITSVFSKVLTNSENLKSFWVVNLQMMQKLSLKKW